MYTRAVKSTIKFNRIWIYVPAYQGVNFRTLSWLQRAKTPLVGEKGLERYGLEIGKICWQDGFTINKTARKQKFCGQNWTISLPKNCQPNIKLNQQQKKENVVHRRKKTNLCTNLYLPIAIIYILYRENGFGNSIKNDGVYNENSSLSSSFSIAESDAFDESSRTSSSDLRFSQHLE